MRGIVFAPDWLKSTLSGWTDSILPGEPEVVRRGISQRYLMRSLLYNQLLGNGIQYQQTGTMMVDNEPRNQRTGFWPNFIAKNTVHLKDGRELDLSKHFLEFAHMMDDPAQFGLNKMSAPARIATTQLENKQYPVLPTWEHLTATYPPNITRPGDNVLTAGAKRLGNIGAEMMPIPAQQIIQGHPGTAALGALGASVRGTADDEKTGRVDRKREERKLKREQRENR